MTVPALDQALASPLPAVTPAKEAQLVIDSEGSAWPAGGQLEAGQVAYIISIRWWSAWAAYTGLTITGEGDAVVQAIHDAARPSRPGPIDNTDLLINEGDSEDELKTRLREGEDLRIVLEPTWRLLHGWYGGGPELQRPVVTEGIVHKTTRVELYPLKINIYHMGRMVNITASKQSTVSELKSCACKAVGVEEADVCIWDYFQRRKYANLEGKGHDTLDEARIFDNNDILLQPKGEASDDEAEGSSTMVLGPGTSLAMGGPYRLTSLDDAVSTSPGARPGMAGLSNLGNTCFMNSSLQCLSHTVPLLRTFLGDGYKADLNPDNPLGLGGELAEAFGALLKKQWRGGVDVVTPRGFKSKLARFAPQFQGYSQQDSQELLAFLLDGLHEDLNRIQKKPYIEEKDAAGRPDEVVAQEAWSNYRMRNDSVIVDHFQGLYKSTLVCPACSFRSVKFDPFMYLTLPLPESKTRTLTLTLVHVDGAAPPTTYAVTVPKTGNIGHLYKAVAAVAQLPEGAQPEELLLLAELACNRLERTFERPQQRLSDVRERCQLLAYRYPAADRGPRSGHKQVQVFHRQLRSNYGRHSVFSAPLVLFLPEEALQGLEPRPIKAAGWGQEYVILQPPQQFSSALEAALRPFKRQRMEPLAAATTCVDEAVPVDDSNKENEDCNTPPSDTQRTAFATAPRPASDSTGCSGDAMALGGGAGSPEEGSADKGGDEDAMAEPGTPPHHSCSSPAQAACPAPPAPSASPLNDTAAEPVVPLPQPFDMFERQAAAPAGPEEGEAAEPASSSGAEEAAGRPFKLKAAQFDGQTQALAEPGPHRGVRYFSLDWQQDGGGEYDLGRLESPQVHDSARHASNRDSAPASVSLDQCMRAFTQPEQLEQEDSWFCSECKSHVQADKKLDVWSLPEVLVVHLKRFGYSRLWRDKLDTPVDFPLQGLDLSPYLLHKVDGPPPLYDLYAVSNHYGGMGGGHYTAYCRMPDDGKWYCYDDSCVREVGEGAVRSPAAYVLFYRRRDAHEREQGLQLQARMEPQPEAGIPETGGPLVLVNGGSGTNGRLGGRSSSSSSVERDACMDPKAQEEGDGVEPMETAQAPLARNSSGSSEASGMGL